MTEFQHLEIDLRDYGRIAEMADFFESVGERIEDAVTGRRGDGDWFGTVHLDVPTLYIPIPAESDGQQVHLVNTDLAPSQDEVTLPVQPLFDQIFSKQGHAASLLLAIAAR